MLRKLALSTMALVNEAVWADHGGLPSHPASFWTTGDVAGVTLSGAALVAALACFWQLRRNARPAGPYSHLARLVASAELGKDNGVLYLDNERRILAASRMLLTMAGLDDVGILGRTVEQVYTARFSRFLFELQQKSLATRSSALAEILDWAPYTPVAQGPVHVSASPAMENGQPNGYIIVFRSAQEMRLMEASVSLHQAHFQVLFDTIQVGVALFKPTISPVDGGPDGILLDANPAFEKLTDGVSLPFNEPCTVAWPGFLTNTRLREGLSQIHSGSSDSYRLEFVSPSTGRYLDMRMAPLPGDRLLVTVMDRTEQRQSEEQVLQLNDQLKQALAKQDSHLGQVFTDIDHFNEALSDRMSVCLELAMQMKAALPPERLPECHQLIQNFQTLFTQVMEYHSVASLPYKENQLFSIDLMMRTIIESWQSTAQDITFEVKPLPSIVGSPSVVEGIFKRLLAIISALPHNLAARVEVGEFGDFLNAGMYLDVTGFDSTALFSELSAQTQDLDWTVTGDLELAVVRRMVDAHGGQMLVAALDDHGGFRISITIGTPP